MARGNITIAVTGTYNDADVKAAIRDLQQLQTKASPAAGAFQKLGQSFSSFPMALTSQFLGVGVAIGAVSWMALLSNADDALFAAKAKGRNAVAEV